MSEAKLDHAIEPAPARPPASAAPPGGPRPSPLRRGLYAGIGVVALVVVLYLLVPWLILTFSTVSTDDAYVNGHFTFVAARVPGQVKKGGVLVDDNYRVKKGQKLVELDPEPYEVLVAIKKAAVTAADTDLVAARAQVQGLVALTRANRFKLEHAIENVNNQVANLRALTAVLTSKKATEQLAKENYKRGEDLAPKGSISKEEFDQRREALKVATAAVEQTQQQVYAIRVNLGLTALPAAGKAVDDVPDDLDQNFSMVRQALGELLQSAAQVGFFPTSWNATPKEAVAAFYKQDPEGNLDRIYQRLIPNAPPIKQAEAKLLQAQKDLAQAELNLRYCTVFAEIDGVVTRRSVNDGNNVAAGQSLMAIRSLTEIWVDANFKETQLAELRIGQRVRLEIDMYGSRKEYEGRITGFTMGTGQTLALLPPQNATGNFVKIVQRLPVKIELNDYDSKKSPLFIGLSATPYVYIYQALIGDDPGKGEALQPYRAVGAEP